ncbi:hypothetical protein L9F63_023730, partial [Diploptera punctata]
CLEVQIPFAVIAQSVTCLTLNVMMLDSNLSSCFFFILIIFFYSEEDVAYIVATPLAFQTMVSLIFISCSFPAQIRQRGLPLQFSAMEFITIVGEIVGGIPLPELTKPPLINVIPKNYDYRYNMYAAVYIVCAVTRLIE